MKKNFSKHWKESKQPRKQRKYRARAPLHIKQKFLSSNLSKELRKKYKKRNTQLRSGDTVKIMRGTFKGKTGKIEKVDIKRSRVGIEKIQRTKKDGTKVGVFFNPSNLQLKELNLEDKERIKSLERKIKAKKGDENKNKTKEEINKNKKGDK